MLCPANISIKSDIIIVKYFILCIFASNLIVEREYVHVGIYIIIRYI